MAGEPALDQVLASAARMQELVPDAVLVGGSAAALYAHHRESFDHHVLTDPTGRYAEVVEAVDYLDMVALTDRLGLDPAVDLLTGIDGYYADRSGEADSVLTSLVVKLSQPSPRDVAVTRQLDRYKGLDRRWHEWSAVVTVCRQLADRILARLEDAAG